MKGSFSCRRCGRWLEGEWTKAASPEERVQLQRRMDQGICDECWKRELERGAMKEVVKLMEEGS